MSDGEAWRWEASGDLPLRPQQRALALALQSLAWAAAVRSLEALPPDVVGAVGEWVHSSIARRPRAPPTQSTVVRTLQQWHAGNGQLPRERSRCLVQ
jgi:hypothetical protein